MMKSPPPPALARRPPLQVSRRHPLVRVTDVVTEIPTGIPPIGITAPPDDELSSLSNLEDTGHEPPT